MTDPVLSLASAVLAVAALHGLGLGVALLRSDRRPRRARLALAALTLVMSALLGSMALVFSGVAWPVGRAIVGSLWLAVGPLFYLVVRFRVPARAAWQPEDAVHALPLALQGALMLAFTLAPIAAPEMVAAGRPALGVVFVLLYGLQTVAYAAIAARIVADDAARYRREGAGEAVETLDGMRRLTALFGVYAAAVAVNVAVFLATGAFIGWLDYLVPLALAALVWAVGYGLLRRPEAVLPALALPDDPPAPAPRPEAARHADALRALMETERPYLDPEVRLADLAARLAVSERVLSHVLAEAVGGSFYDVVNGYRVAEAQARLADPAHAHRTVLAVGLDSGFSSKASFNRVFKQRTGETPSAYRRRTAGAGGDGAALPTPAGDGAVREAEAA